MERCKRMKASGISWIQDIPEHWGIRAIFQLADQVKNKNKELNEKNLLSLSYGKIKRQDINDNEGLLPESFDNYNIIENGDVVLRLTDLQNDHTSLRVGLSKEHGIITSAYITLRPTAIVYPNYLYYVLHAYDLVKGFYGMGAGVRQGLNYDEVKTIKLPFPPLEEQIQIASYIEDQVSRIDSIIEDAKNTIDDYKKWKTSVISEAVTKGIKGNASLRDSGIEWIGYVPEHWRLYSLTKAIDSIVDYRGKTPEKVSSGVFLVTAKNIKDGRIDYSISKEYVRADQYDDIMHRGSLEIGDVLFTTEAPLGQVANVDRTDFALAQRIIKFRAKKELLDNYFLKYWILSFGFQENLITHATGSTAKGIKASKLGLLKIMVPPIEEQVQIVNYLDSKCESIETIVNEKQALIEDLELYKRSVIFETVTGKRKVV